MNVLNQRKLETAEIAVTCPENALSLESLVRARCASIAIQLACTPILDSSHLSEHISKNCPVPKNDGIPILSAEEAWAELVKADEAKDSDDVQFAFDIYSKACPQESFQEIETKLRNANMNTRLVSLKKEEIPANKIILNNKNEEVEFVLQFQIGPRNRRTKSTAGGISSDAEENFKRLSKTGRLVDCPVPVCNNCKEKGHLGREEQTHVQPLRVLIAANKEFLI
ncbi:DNA-binding protein HEXBP [Neolecta irregularis DAH-3]|uniref:DNA-binding protein HEXBP n=1 Tax=Neolecta irregularis (strain DAH-3) TaxID=1198029 RepID=A0A1U7LLV8_NEOID|nr:DNA-binding protein HEXBP [Neolecta irregularis DAH-3]|eukprot:OLL23650.1 DNA-binding protein HEXBP [Neolecta irregularis DAH-3]